MKPKKLAAALATSTLVVGGALVATAPAEAITYNALHINPSRPIVDEKFSAAGKLSTSVVRTAKLQGRYGDSWKTVDTDTTSSTGEFKTQHHTGVDRKFRIYAPAVTVKGKRYGRIVGPTRLVDVVTQTVTVTVSDTTPMVGDVLTFTAQFYPIRQGRDSLLRLRDGDDQVVTFETKPQRSTGRVRWYAQVEEGDAGESAQVWATALAAHGAARVSSPEVQIDVQLLTTPTLN